MSKSKGKIAVMTVIAWFATLLFLFPILWFFLLSLKDPQLTFASPPVFFFTPTLQAYEEILFHSNAPKQLVNSLIVAGGNTLLCLALGVPAAYAFSRFRFRGRRDLLFTFLSVRMAPPIAVLLPFYLLMRNLNLVGTHLAMILINVTVNMPLVIWLMKDFFNEVSESLDEMAMIDGCSRFKAFWRIVLPLALPGIMVSTVFAFIFSWNEFLFALVFSNMHTQTLTVGTASFWTNVQLEWHKLAVAATMTIIPPLVLAISLGKMLIRGLTLGAVKG
jgi:multiple sugar transport system permease protein